MSVGSTDREAIAFLRALGVKAAHPDDGWVDREGNSIHLAYPLFNDGVEVGDTIALGWPRKGYRLVRVVGFTSNPFALSEVERERWRIRFEETTATPVTPSSSLKP